MNLPFRAVGKGATLDREEAYELYLALCKVFGKNTPKRL